MNNRWLAVIGISLALILVVGLAGVGGWLLRDSIARVLGESGVGSVLGWRGWGPGMMGGSARVPYDGTEDVLPCCDWSQVPGTTTGSSVAIGEAQEAVEQYLVRRGYEDREVHEVMEFTRNFYAIVGEQSTGIGAMELLIDKETGAVGPEQGPNMMWNAKYGLHGGGGMMMGGGTSGRMSVTDDEAQDIAQRWLDEYRPGTVAESHADPFYGYYTIHTLRDGEISGMLSVHGSTGQVWYHNWHGDFVQMIEIEEHESHS